MTVDKMQIETTMVIQSINGLDEIKHHMQHLGFKKGDKITLISRLSNNYIVIVKNTRYGIEKKVAQAIEVM